MEPAVPCKDLRKVCLGHNSVVVHIRLVADRKQPGDPKEILNELITSFWYFSLLLRVC